MKQLFGHALILILPLLVSARIGESSLFVQEEQKYNRTLSLRNIFNFASAMNDNNEDDEVNPCGDDEEEENTPVPTPSEPDTVPPTTIKPTLSPIAITSSPTRSPTINPRHCPTLINKAAGSLQKKNAFVSPVSQRQSLSLSCPDPQDPPVEVPPEANIVISKSSFDKLCTLTFLKHNPDGDDIIIPVGKTYDGHNWELSSGPFVHSIQFDCSPSSCTFVTPSKLDSSPQSKFQLTSFELSSSSSQLKSQNIAARFFEQVTFGTKRSDIASFIDLPNMDVSSARHALESDLAEWAHDQMYTEEETPISFRAHFRRNSDTRLRDVENIGKPNHVCSENTRWRKYAFTMTAGAFSYKEITIEKVITTNFKTAYSFSQGGVVVTELLENDAKVKETWDGQRPETILPPGTYNLCMPKEVLGESGFFGLSLDGYCREFKVGNPPIQFLSIKNQPQHVFDNVPLSALDEFFIPVPGTVDDSGDYLLPGGSTDPKCETFNGKHYPIYIRFSDGTYMAFDPRLELIENTLENPVIDGGNSAYVYGSLCPNAFRTFVNAGDGCVYSDEIPACSNDNITPDLEIKLSDENVKTLHDLTQDFPYIISGLRVETFGNPCILNGRSRFMRTGKTEAQCPVTNFNDGTGDYLKEYLRLSNDADSDILDMFHEYPDQDCTIPVDMDLTANPLYVYADDECWLLVHPGK